MGSWQAAADAQGPSTIIGRIESPRDSQNIASGSNVLVAGWAADTTATGWAGIDGAEVWSGAKDKSGTKLASGTVGLPRADVGDAIGSTFVNSGFSAVVPASALQSLSGSQTLFVYLHTPNKGTWYRSVGVNLIATPALQFANDPIVTFTRPIAGEIITQRQKNNKYSIQGFALDRNPPGVGQNPGGSASGCHCGIASVFLYLDKTPSMPGYTPTQNDLGVGNVGPCGIGCGFSPLVNNVSSRGPIVDFGDTGQGNQAFPNASFVTGQYGPQFNLSGFSFGINPNAYSPNLPVSSSNIQPDTFHTFYAVATSSITGKVSVATTSLFIRSTGSDFPVSSAVAP